MGSSPFLEVKGEVEREGGEVGGWEEVKERHPWDVK